MLEFLETPDKPKAYPVINKNKYDQLLKYLSSVSYKEGQRSIKGRRQVSKKFSKNKLLTC